jgi:hypothetical protein
MHVGGIRRPRTGVTPAAKALAPNVPAPTRAATGAADEPSAIFLVCFTGLAEAISTSEGRFAPDFARGTTMLSGSAFFFPGTFAGLPDVLP